MNSSRRKKSLKTSTIIKIVVILAIVVVLVFVLVRVLRSKVSEQFSSSGNEEVQSAQVETGSISTVVSGSGTLTNEDSEDTFIPATVDITEVYVEAGDTVEKGDMLASVNSSSVVKAMNEVQEKRADYEDELQDLIAIYKEGAVYAKNNGLVTAISETEDETTTTTTAVSGGMSQGSFTTVTDDSDEEDGTTISICPTDSMTIALSVDETDILSLEVGQTAEVTISSLSDETYEATLTDIDTVGSSSNGVTSYTATLTLDRVDGMLNGMSASAAITIEGRDNALLVPVEAVHKTSSTSYVYTEYDEETGEFGGMTEVTTGLSNSNYTEITSGLSEGDTVYYTETEEEGFDFGGMGGMEEMFGGGGHSGGSGGAPSGGDFGGGGMPSGGGRSGN